MGKNKRFYVTPNVVNYIEMNEERIDFHYSARPAWTVYLGDKAIYRSATRMLCIADAWEAEPAVFNQLMNEVEDFLQDKSRKRLVLLVKGKRVSLRFADALLLREEMQDVLGRLWEQKYPPGGTVKSAS